MLAVRASGVPSRQELLLFDDIVVCHPKIGPSRTQDELDFLSDRKALRRVDIASLFKSTDEHPIDQKLITGEIADSIASECRLFGGASSSAMIEQIVRSRHDEVNRTPRGHEYVDHPGSDRIYNELTRFIASTMRFAYSTSAIGLLREDRSARPEYRGYVSKMAYTSPRLEMPKALASLIPESQGSPRGSRYADAASRPTLPWIGDELRGATQLEQLYEVILSRVPSISETTHWEDILAFRAEPEARLSFLELHRWVRKLTSSNMSIAELREELDYLLAQNIVHLKRSKIKHRVGMLRMIVSLGPSAISNILQGKFKELRDLPFQIYEKIGAQRAERRNLPAQELGYFVAIDERFRR